MGAVKSVGPNEALVKSGTFANKSIKKIIAGGWLFKSIGTNVMRVSLTLMTVYPKCDDAETSLGVQIHVSGAAHVKVKRELVKIAAEQFGGKNREDVRLAIEATVAGHLRSILSTMTVEEAYKDRLKFAEAVRDEAEVDLAQMGFTIVSFVILDVSDDVGYFSSLGKTAIANVKRDAAIGIAEADRDASLSEFDCLSAINKARLKNKVKIEEWRRNYDVARYGYQREMLTAKAEADLAYSLSAAKQFYEIRREEKEIEVIEKRKQVEIERLQIDKTKLELVTNVKLPAVAECHRIETIAEGMKSSDVLIEQTVRENRKVIGKSLAIERLEIGSARIERLLYLAEVFKTYGQTAMASRILEAIIFMDCWQVWLENVCVVVLTSLPTNAEIAAKTTRRQSGPDLRISAVLVPLAGSLGKIFNVKD